MNISNQKLKGGNSGFAFLNAKRTMDIFKLKERTLMKIISDKSKANDTEVESSEPKCEKRGRKEKLDTFQKDLTQMKIKS